jgi:hypothetical protein
MARSFVHSTATEPSNTTVSRGDGSDRGPYKQGRKRSPVSIPNHVSDATYPAHSRATEEGLEAHTTSPQVSSPTLMNAFARIKAKRAKILLEVHKKHFPRPNEPKLGEQSSKSPSSSTFRCDEEPPSFPVTQDTAESMYFPAPERQPPLSTDNHSQTPTNLSFQSSRDQTPLKDGKECEAGG